MYPLDAPERIGPCMDYVTGYGFARVRCQACADEILVVFSWNIFGAHCVG